MNEVRRTVTISSELSYYPHVEDASCRRGSCRYRRRVHDIPTKAKFPSFGYRSHLHLDARSYQANKYQYNIRRLARRGHRYWTSNTKRVFLGIDVWISLLDARDFVSDRSAISGG